MTKGKMGKKEMNLEQAQLIKLVIGYWHSQALFAANSLNTFTELSQEGSATAEELANRGNVPVDSLERLLNACVTIGLLEKKNGRYNNSSLSEHVLVKGKPNFMGNWIRFMSDWYHPWGKLLQAVYSGKPVESPEGLLGSKEDYTRNFILGMHDYAIGPGRDLVDKLDLTGRKKLLDVGGGAGTYSILFAKKNPQLRCVVFDLPQVVDIAQGIVDSFGLSSRVSVQPGNYYKDDFGNDNDVVFFSNVLHQEDPAICTMIIQKAYNSLVKDGMIIINGSFLNAEKDGPMWPAFQSLFLLLIYDGGRAYTAEETIEILSKVGFVESTVKRISLLNAESMIMARKP